MAESSALGARESGRPGIPTSRSSRCVDADREGATPDGPQIARSVRSLGAERVTPIRQVFFALAAPLVTSRRHVEYCAAMETLPDEALAEADEVVLRIKGKALDPYRYESRSRRSGRGVRLRGT